jgi:hypothetical protein
MTLGRSSTSNCRPCHEECCCWSRSVKWVIAGAGAADRDARSGNEMCGTDCIIRLENGVVLCEDDEAQCAVL